MTIDLMPCLFPCRGRHDRRVKKTGGNMLNVTERASEKIKEIVKNGKMPLFVRIFDFLKNRQTPLSVRIILRNGQ